jgi:hypothetical protein
MKQTVKAVKEKESNTEDVSTLLSDVQKWKKEFKVRRRIQ